MTEEIVKVQITRPQDRQPVEDADRAVAKREHFLALLKKQYGYTNDKAVDELERILKMFYTMNKSLGIHQVQTNIQHPQISALNKDGKNFNLQMRVSREGESNEKRSRFMD